MKKRATPRTSTTQRKRCAIYTRKSTVVGLEQEFNTLEAQRDACADYVHRQVDWMLLENRYDDGGYTGANTDRPAFQRLLADVDAGQIDVILVYKLDRLSRSLLDFAQMMARFDAVGVSFVSVTQNFSTADAIGRLTLNMLMSFAEFERDMISDRTRDKIAAARRRGKWTGGPVPLGYSVSEGKLVVNASEAAVVSEIFQLYFEYRSALEVVRILNERHRDTKRHHAASGRIRESRAWTAPDVYRVLHNPLYAGYVVADGERHDGEHQAIISRETFRLLETALAAAPSRRGPQPNPDYLLRGVLRCGVCGAAFTPASTTTSGVAYRYYRCVTRDKQGRKACPAKPLPADQLERFVVDHLRKAISESGGTLAAEVTAAVQTQIARGREAAQGECNTLPAQIAALRKEAHGVAEVVGAAEPAVRTLLQAQLSNVSDQLARREARLSLAERELAQLHDLELETSWVCRCLRDFGRVWDVMTPSNRARLLRAVVDQVVVDEPAGTFEISLADLHAAQLAAADQLTQTNADAQPGVGQ
jgi:DNA invertase Pin-like site-specific DNA recombinase